VVKRIERAIPRLKPGSEGRTAHVAVALAAVFVGQMPDEEGGVVTVAFSQLGVDRVGLLAIDRRGEAVIVALSEEVALAVGAHAEDLGIGAGEPRGACSARCGKHGIGPVLCQHVHDPVEPVKGEPTLGRLKGRPGKDAYRHRVAVRQLHQAHVLCPHIGGPLVRVVVTAVQKHGGFAVDGGIDVLHQYLLAIGSAVHSLRLPYLSTSILGQSHASTAASVAPTVTMSSDLTRRWSPLY